MKPIFVIKDLRTGMYGEPFSVSDVPSLRASLYVTCANLIRFRDSGDSGVAAVASFRDSVVYRLGNFDADAFMLSPCDPLIVVRCDDVYEDVIADYEDVIADNDILCEGGDNSEES